MIYVTRSFNFWFLLVLFSVLQQKNLQVLSPFVFFPVLLRMRRYTFPPISLNLFPKIIQRHNFRITFLKISIWSTFPKRIFKKPPLYFGFINSFRGGIQTYAFFFLFDFAWGNHFFIAGLFAKSINSCFVRIEGGGDVPSSGESMLLWDSIRIAFFRPPPPYESTRFGPKLVSLWPFVQFTLLTAVILVPMINILSAQGNLKSTQSAMRVSATEKVQFVAL